MRGESHREESLLPVVTATVVGLVGTAAALWYARRRDGRAHPDLERSDLEREVRAALRQDEKLSRRGVLVTELGSGVVELAGMVESSEEMAGAVAASQRVDGVNTVVNRLAVRDEESRLADTRERFQAGDAALTETHWTGLHIGMGRRRQSPLTDPDRRDDHARMKDRELQVNRVAREELAPDIDGGDWGSDPLRDGYGKELQ